MDVKKRIFTHGVITRPSLSGSWDPWITFYLDKVTFKNTESIIRYSLSLCIPILEPQHREQGVPMIALARCYGHHVRAIALISSVSPQTK